MPGKGWSTAPTRMATAMAASSGPRRSKRSEAGGGAMGGGGVGCGALSIAERCNTAAAPRFRPASLEPLAKKHDRTYPPPMLKGEATRERIVEEAVRLASREGLDGVSLGALAGELGMSKSGLYAHFGSKDELQLQILQAAVARF